jgi:carotenoid cleavage dioxygenase
MINGRHGGRKYRYAYSTIAQPGWFLFKGFVKTDLETGKTSEYSLGQGRFASEAPFAPRIGAIEEDDGYLVSFVTDENSGTSECILLDARHLEDGPVCRIALPHKLCSGTHACWAGRERLRACVYNPEKEAAHRSTVRKLRKYGRDVEPGAYFSDERGGGG